MRFDAPFTRLLERNDFREALIDYQKERRRLLQFEDTVHTNLRRLIRELEQHRANLELQRQAVVIAIRRVAQTRQLAERPAAPTPPGQLPEQLGTAASLNMLTALSDLRTSQNNLLGVWLSYYATRLLLLRELGSMDLDNQGIWMDRPIAVEARLFAEEVPLPPGVPEEILSVPPEDLLEARPAPEDSDRS